jgi:TetR/AcrR family transcriptional regulator
MTSEGLSYLSRKLSGKMETISAEFYRDLIQAAMAQGTISRGLDARVAALCIDNLILMIQHSYTSDYFKERLKVFIGPDALSDDEKIVNGTMAFIRGALSV